MQQFAMRIANKDCGDGIKRVWGKSRDQILMLAGKAGARPEADVAHDSDGSGSVVGRTSWSALLRAEKRAGPLRCVGQAPFRAHISQRLAVGETLAE